MSDRETGVGKTDPVKSGRRPWASCLLAPTLRPPSGAGWPPHPGEPRARSLWSTGAGRAGRRHQGVISPAAGLSQRVRAGIGVHTAHPSPGNPETLNPGSADTGVKAQSSLFISTRTLDFSLVSMWTRQLSLQGCFQRRLYPPLKKLREGV